jgi:hypothetical protein
MILFQFHGEHRGKLNQREKEGDLFTIDRKESGSEGSRDGVEGHMLEIGVLQMEEKAFGCVMFDYKPK